MQVKNQLLNVHEQHRILLAGEAGSYRGLSCASSDREAGFAPFLGAQDVVTVEKEHVTVY